MEKLRVAPHRRSPSGGYHADFDHPGWHVPTLNSKTKRSLGERWPGLDIRGDGGYIAIAGRASNGSYKWLRDPEPYPVDILPSDLREVLGLLRPPSTTTSGNSRVDPERLIRMALERASSDGRNNAGVWLACQLRDNGYNQSEAADAMRKYRARCPDINSKGDHEEYTEAETQASLREAYSRPPREPWDERATSGGSPSEVASPHETAEIKPAVPEGFELNAGGVHKIRHTDHGESLMWICDRLEVLAHGRSTESDNWSKQLRFRDREGHTHQLLLPASMLAKDKGEVCAKLLGQGLRMSSHKEAQAYLREYIYAAEPSVYARTVERTGWYRHCFVLPDETIGRTGGELILLQPAREHPHWLHTSGDLDGWRANVAYFCQGNSLLTFAVSCAFAAPLLPFSGDPGGGFHLFATSSVGKTTILVVAGSVWGGGGKDGYVETWSTTANGLENTAEAHNHSLLPLDELKLIDPEQASKVAYTLANGQRKIRQTQEGNTQRKAEWQLLFLSNGELSLKAHLEEVQRRFYGGQAIRFCELPARVSEEFGAFEKIHCFGSPREFAKHLRKKSLEYYGTAARAFLRRLTEQDPDTIRMRLKAISSEFIRKHVPAGASEELVRGADRFALVAAGGEMATQFGITGWFEGDAEESAAKCFNAWRLERGTDGRSEEHGVILVIRHQLMAHGDSRFQYFGNDRKERDSTYRISNRLGYRTRNAEDKMEYLLQKAELAEICKPYSIEFAISALRKSNLLDLEKGSGDLTVRRTPPDIPRSRFYAISSRIFEDEQCSFPFNFGDGKTFPPENDK